MEIDNSSLGESALAVEPDMQQAFIGIGSNVTGTDHFEHKRFVMRKRFEKEVRYSQITDREYFYFPSLSCYTMVYKGMLTPEQLDAYFAADLRDESLESALCMFHSRFSTN